jgi:hypothetical protein
VCLPSSKVSLQVAVVALTKWWRHNHAHVAPLKLGPRVAKQLAEQLQSRSKAGSSIEMWL